MAICPAPLARWWLPRARNKGTEVLDCQARPSQTKQGRNGKDPSVNELPNCSRCFLGVSRVDGELALGQFGGVAGGAIRR
jgi:hypothetical protein